ncbi:uncharacterized protein LOC143019103 [Oratosquilla oratoria]|uniref:uncharacterized protein LOC143019103 n=1 Tax=Oratosquilla oratoria TaxID=337810 RepID=UPI003F77655B
MDKANKTAEYYRAKYNELDTSPVFEPISAPRSGGSSSLDVIRPSRNPSTNNSRSPSRTRSLVPSRINSRRNSVSEDKNQDRARSRRNSSTELEYVDMRHVTDAEVDRMIHDGEENILWHVVYSGQGHKLQSKSAWNKDIRNFLKKVPGTQAKIKSLHEAASEGNFNRVKQLTWENPKLAMARNKEGATPLHFAARSGDVVVTKHLLELYPDAINVADEDGRTPLHWAAAASEGDTSATYDFLSGEGGDTQMEDWEGVKPRDLLQGNSQQTWGHSQGPPSDHPKDKELDKEIEDAVRDAENDNYKAMTDIILRGDGRYFVGRKTKDSDLQHFLDQIPRHLESIEELHEAVEKGETRRVINLLDRKQKARTRDRNHANILHKAVLFGHTDLVRYLVTSFPDLLDHKDRAGRTPLHYAGMIRDGGHIYKILEKSGGNNTVKDNKNYTPEDYVQNPALMSQWDLKKELEEGIPDPESDSRPYTKGSEAICYYCNPAEGVTHVDEEILECIDEAYNILLTSSSRSLLKKYLTRDVYDKIKDRVTPNGASLLDVINSGVENVDSNIGIYAPDAESYSIFHELFDPIIDEYHGGFSPSSCHPRLNFGHANSLGDLNSKGDFVVSTRVRCARSIEGYPFNPLLTNDHYAELEEDIVRALESLDENLSGQYTPISRLSPEDQEDLLERHLLFKQGDRFLQAAGACRYWPDGRGIFLNDDSTLVVWVNEEDHMRIISMEPGGDLGAVYERFTRAVTSLGHILPFSSSQRFGFLTFCPTNLGTAIRASVHIRLPNLGEDRRILEDTADRFNLQVRGTSGEHSEAKDFVFDISNRRRLGLTEIEALQEMYDGVQEIIDMEIQMSEAFTSDLSTLEPELDTRSLIFDNDPAYQLQNSY